MSTRRSLRIGLVALGAALLLGVAAVTSRAQDPAPDTQPVAKIRDIMMAVNHKGWGLYGMIRKDLREDTLDADHWTLVRHRAAMMAECGNLLMGLVNDRPKGDAATWMKHAGDYKKCAQELQMAASLGDMDEARSASDSLAKRCDECHADHQLN
jgi:hypothetical protein